MFSYLIFTNLARLFLQSNQGEWWSSTTAKQPSSLFPPSILRSSSSEKEEKEEEKQSSLLPPSILRSSSSPHSSTDDPKLDINSNAKEKGEREKEEVEEQVEEEDKENKAERLETEVWLSLCIDWQFWFFKNLQIQVCVPDLVLTNCEDDGPSLEVKGQVEEEKLKENEVKPNN